MDYIFWGMLNQDSKPINLWIIWSIWKTRNDKVFSNIDKDPKDILKQVEFDADEWFQANATVKHIPNLPLVEASPIWDVVSRLMISNLSFTGFKCFVDKAWRASDVLSGIAWSCFSDSMEKTFCGGRAIPRSFSPLHAEVKAVLWAMQCLLSLGILEVNLATDCSDILKILSNPEDWSVFSSFIEDFSRLMNSFSFFSVRVTPRLLNHRVDFIACSFRR